MKSRAACAVPLLVCLAVDLYGQVPCPDLEIVESVPEGTALDSPDVRDTGVVWIEMIRGAKATLDIEQFYVSNKKGQALEAVIEEILAAARRGVRVRILADALFYRSYPKTLERMDQQPNVEVRRIDFKKLQGEGVQHAKFFIVDAEQVFLGSQNFD